MKKTKLFTLIIMILVFASSCIVNRNRVSCETRKPLFKKYQPRIQGSEKWNYKKYQGPKRKVLK